MSDVERRFHETWLGHVQPIDGLVVSVPVLVDAQCMSRQPPDRRNHLRELTFEVESGLDAPLDVQSDTATATMPLARRRIGDLPTFLESILDLTPDLFDVGDAIDENISLYVPEGQQTIRPSFALRHQAPVDTPPYVALVWQVPDGLDVDKPETETGPWSYPAAAKFERLLRHTRIPIGLLTNGEVLRLVYAPNGESTGAINFRVTDMAEVWGRPVLDAFCMLLSAHRFFGASPEYQLPALLADSRTRQADVTQELASQVFDALQILLRGFEAAAARDGTDVFDDALRREEDHVYGGLLTTLLRLVFILYAEDRGLLPVDSDFYERHLSVLALYDRLQADAGSFPDSMHERFGAWAQLVMLFRTVFLGARHGEFGIPARRGELFDPHRFPFLEGWTGPSAPITQPDQRAEVELPSIDDGTVYAVLERLLVLDGQRLSYKALDVEQIGSVYEALMGYHVVQLTTPAVCIGPKRVWVSVADVREQRPAGLAKWLKSETSLTKAKSETLARTLRKSISGSKDEPGAEGAILDALETCRLKGTARAAAGSLVLQPGVERKRTSSHYTPRSLSGPIVERTLAPLLKAMGDAPSSEAILELKVCDPAMGSGAFLVGTCRYLASELEAAWTREGRIADIAAAHDNVATHAKRLIAQRCLYGVDRNAFAVSLAKLSLWLETLARDLPFTFVDHAFRHGDSLVGLSFEDVRAFHWKADEKTRNLSEQAELLAQERLLPRHVDVAIDEAIRLREQILALANDDSPESVREKDSLARDAADALERVRLAADLIVGAFFSSTKAKEREAERARREQLVALWLSVDGPPPAELKEMQREIRERIPIFHWMLEFPEVFQVGRVDPLTKAIPGGNGGEAAPIARPDAPAYLDAVVGNPPFAGKNGITAVGGREYLDWLKTIHVGSHGNADLCAHFFRRAAVLLGEHGTIGLIATNTISQGDTRDTGLKALVANGFEIHDAVRSMAWPVRGAAVTIAVAHLARGAPRALVDKHTLDGAVVPAISSRLRGNPERPDPVALRSNAGLSFQGSIVLGMGFVLTPEEREVLVARNSRNEERIFPYIGGEEVNTSPTQDFHRYVINFGDMSLEEAEQWPDLIAIVREQVKPQREGLRDNPIGRQRKANWWQFASRASSLYNAIAPLERCLVTAQVTKHLCFSFQPPDRVFSQKLFAFPLTSFTSFSVLQSRAHASWTWLLSSTLKSDLNYSSTDCFENFPFPEPNPRSVIDPLEAIGKRLYHARAAFMRDTDQGLTKTYNALKDASVADSAVAELRELHLQLDRAVLGAYGWDDIDVPPITTPETDDERQRLATFEDAVIDRLFVLNAERASADRAT